jgi:hypothetical protein
VKNLFWNLKGAEASAVSLRFLFILIRKALTGDVSLSKGHTNKKRRRRKIDYFSYGDKYDPASGQSHIYKTVSKSG